MGEVIIDQEKTITDLRNGFPSLSAETPDDAAFVKRIAKTYSGRRSFSDLWRLGISFRKVLNIAASLNPELAIANKRRNSDDRPDDNFFGYDAP